MGAPWGTPHTNQSTRPTLPRISWDDGLLDAPVAGGARTGGPGWPDAAPLEGRPSVTEWYTGDVKKWRLNGCFWRKMVACLDLTKDIQRWRLNGIPGKQTKKHVETSWFLYRNIPHT